ncbi:MAG: FKBP-type peptidyl-prolyl cis-trans isomerase [Prevotellaceae bacterium]|jgi:FKBP-type peptidyl-prolyl cis-trans isomerase|nr:FKBP-type peptidyl-prolyl cis-trans isomerase [Prevotellaceae bacterium]
MKKIAILIVLSFCFSIGFAQSTVLKTEKDSAAYALGVYNGNATKQQFTDININLLAKGIVDAYNGENQYFKNSEEVMNFLNNYFNKEQAKAGEANKAEGEKFLAENAKRKGVKTTASGLQYEVIVTGKGAKPTDTAKVKVHYRGTLIDGTEFDSSYSRNEPAVFGVTQVISGWTEALKLMPVGSKWKIYLPYNLAYGERGAGGEIKPYSALVFEVELLDIEK